MCPWRGRSAPAVCPGRGGRARGAPARLRHACRAAHPVGPGRARGARRVRLPVSMHGGFGRTVAGECPNCGRLCAGGVTGAAVRARGARSFWRGYGGSSTREAVPGCDRRVVQSDESALAEPSAWHGPAMGMEQPQPRAPGGGHIPVVARPAAPVGIVEPPFRRDPFRSDRRRAGVLLPPPSEADRRRGPHAGWRGPGRRDGAGAVAGRTRFGRFGWRGIVGRRGAGRHRFGPIMSA